MSQECCEVTHKCNNYYSPETSHTQPRNLAIHFCIADGGLTAKFPMCFRKNFHYPWSQLTSQGCLGCQGGQTLLIAIRGLKWDPQRLVKFLSYALILGTLFPNLCRELQYYNLKMWFNSTNTYWAYNLCQALCKTQEYRDKYCFLLLMGT